MTDEAARRRPYVKPGSVKQFFINLASDPALRFQIEATEERVAFSHKENKDVLDTFNERLTKAEAMAGDTAELNRKLELLTKMEVQIKAFETKLKFVDDLEGQVKKGLKKIDGVDHNLTRMETAIEHVMLRDFSSAGEIEVPLVNTGIDGRLQMLEEKLEAVQTRLDILSIHRSAD